jgi:hypothetical protein
VLLALAESSRNVGYLVAPHVSALKKQESNLHFFQKFKKKLKSEIIKKQKILKNKKIKKQKKTKKKKKQKKRKFHKKENFIQRRHVLSSPADSPLPSAST